MSWNYKFNENIDLFVKGKILEEDANRQSITAKSLLFRLKKMPGQILADEVGMGKTFVALAVAVSVALEDRKRPVVIMIPPILTKKWPKDLEVFKQKCLPQNIRNKLRSQVAESTVDFLKLLDDSADKRNSIIFLTHGAFHRTMGDGFIKLAIIQRALFKRRNTEGVFNSLERFGAHLFRLNVKRNQEIISALLNLHPSEWKKRLIRFNVWTEEEDDPVPMDLVRALRNLGSDKFDNIVDVLFNQLPSRVSPNLNSNLNLVKENLNKEFSLIWNLCMQELKIRLPLLILDEAHHLKNAHTKFASLFQSANEEKALKDGYLTGVFERMLFLTATPFQLGHYELCNVMSRFNAISWNNKTAPEKGQGAYQKYLDDLIVKLDYAQRAAQQLDTEWQKLRSHDLTIENRLFQNSAEWWKLALVANEEKLTNQTQRVLKQYQITKAQMLEAEELLKEMVVRHLRSRELPGNHGKRRISLNGKSIVDESTEDSDEGLALNTKALLPFLLASRLTAITPETRPVFAEGLASSFEAFLHTRERRKQKAPVLDDDVAASIKLAKTQKYYLDEIESFLKRHIRRSEEVHTKLAATIEKVAALWMEGEKILVFCHYIATGQALRNKISSRIQKEIIRRGAERLGCAEDVVLDELERIGNKFDNDPLKSFIEEYIGGIIDQYDQLVQYKGDLLDVIKRYLRTPSFLIRFFPVEIKRFDSRVLEDSFNKEDYSKQSINTIIKSFLEFLQERCGEVERQEYIDALLSVQTGGIRGKHIESSFSSDELDGSRGETIIPNVRLANGKVKDETRQKLMLTFNTPFYPDVLIASSVMAEGVDLHLNCRYIIHHDLCWNPSTLEQRTGRVDRIGAKAEVCKLPINVYYPYIEETQDEKMFKVVMDRERWFKVVMGETYKVDAMTTNQLAERIPFPEEAANDLAFKLNVYYNNNI